MKALGQNIGSIAPIQDFTNLMEVLLISAEWLANGGFALIPAHNTVRMYTTF